MAAAFDLSSLDDALPLPVQHHQSQQPQHHHIQHHFQPQPQQHQQHHAFFQHRSPVGHPIPGLSGVRRAGVSKFFSSSKGYGFVIDNNPQDLGGQEVFVHFSAIAGKGGFKSLAEGEEVEYEIVGGPKGYQASNLTGPGGRPVVGDPKARLAKGPPYPPFSPLGMPLPPQYLTDPYHQQLPGNMYAPSPYTQHIVYVPTTSLSHPPSHQQYSFGLPPTQSQTSSVLSSPPGSASNVGSGASYGGAGGYQASQQQSGSYPNLAPGAGAGGYGQHTAQQRGPSNGSAIIGGGGGGGGYGGQFGHTSPPSRNFSLPGGPGSPISGSGPTLTFAPFNSPPSYNNASLFNAPPSFSNPAASPPMTSTTFNLVPSQAGGTSRIASSASNSSAGGAGPVGSSLFGSSGRGTPGEGGRRVATPLGNGTIGTNGNGATSPFAPVLYTTNTPINNSNTTPTTDSFA